MVTPRIPTAVTVGTTPTVLSYAVKGRRSVVIQNAGVAVGFIGYTSDMTAANSFQLPAGGVMTFSKNDGDPVEGSFFGMVAAATLVLVVSEA